MNESEKKAFATLLEEEIQFQQEHLKTLSAMANSHEDLKFLAKQQLICLIYMQRKLDKNEFDKHFTANIKKFFSCFKLQKC